MELSCYQIDAFTEQVFRGNPACVVLLPYWLPNSILLQIARENAVPETAFLVTTNEKLHIRWFTPDLEMDLCGHATLAAAHVLMQHQNYSSNQLVFESQSGPLHVALKGETYFLELPLRIPEPDEIPAVLEESLSLKPKAVLKSRDYVLVYESESDVREITIDRLKFDRINLNTGGVIVTAPGISCDFVSRFFTPQSTILEDPVTGSAHCSLIPYWAAELNKTEMLALQLSERMGTLYCKLDTHHVIVGGKACTYSMGKLQI
jgi:PhzF family phenazine biosynthesis protein